MFREPCSVLVPSAVLVIIRAAGHGTFMESQFTEPAKTGRPRMESSPTAPGLGGQRQGQRHDHGGAQPVVAGGRPVNFSPCPAIAEPEAGHTPWASDRLISIRDIREIFGLGRTAAYELTHRPECPGPVRVSPRCYRWWASEVSAFAASLRSKRAGPLRGRRIQRAAEPSTSHPATPPRRITGKVRAARTRKEAP